MLMEGREETRPVLSSEIWPDRVSKVIDPIKALLGTFPAREKYLAARYENCGGEPTYLDAKPCARLCTAVSAQNLSDILRIHTLKIIKKQEGPP